MKPRLARKSQARSKPRSKNLPARRLRKARSSVSRRRRPVVSRKARTGARELTRARSRRKPRVATTSDIVGRPVKGERIPTKWRQHYNRLIELRNILTRRQVVLNQDALEEQPAFSSHMADAGTDTFDRDFALSLLSADQNAVYEIEEAIERIRDGRYGICEVTGKPIARRRLEAIPWTRFTAEVEEGLERDGVVIRTRLGGRESVEKTSILRESAELEEEEEGEGE